MNQELLSIEIPATVGLGGGKLIFYSDSVEGKGIKLLYNNLRSISYSHTKTSVNFIPTYTTYTYALKSQAEKISYTFQAPLLIGNKHCKEVFSKLIYISKQIIEPLLINKYVASIFQGNEPINIGGVEFSRKGMLIKNLMRDDVEILWSDKIYTPEIHEGTVIIYKEINGEGKIILNVVLSSDNAPIIPELVNACFYESRK